MTDEQHPITDSERKMLTMLREADAVFIATDKGFKTFAWIRRIGFPACKCEVEYGQLDGAPYPRHYKISMGISAKEWKEAVARSNKDPHS